MGQEAPPTTRTLITEALRMVDDEPGLTEGVALNHPALPDPNIDVELESRRTGVRL
jgi:hypothetical protein